jgi:hypothetical protein
MRALATYLAMEADVMEEIAMYQKQWYKKEKCNQ